LFSFAIVFFLLFGNDWTTAALGCGVFLLKVSMGYSSCLREYSIRASNTASVQGEIQELANSGARLTLGSLRNSTAKLQQSQWFNSAVFLRDVS
jgi:hypothetical protein